MTEAERCHSRKADHLVTVYLVQHVPGTLRRVHHKIATLNVCAYHANTIRKACRNRAAFLAQVQTRSDWTAALPCEHIDNGYRSKAPDSPQSKHFQNSTRSAGKPNHDNIRSTATPSSAAAAASNHGSRALPHCERLRQRAQP